MKNGITLPPEWEFHRLVFGDGEHPFKITKAFEFQSDELVSNPKDLAIIQESFNSHLKRWFKTVQIKNIRIKSKTGTKHLSQSRVSELLQTPEQLTRKQAHAVANSLDATIDALRSGEYLDYNLFDYRSHINDMLDSLTYVELKFIYKVLRGVVSPENEKYIPPVDDYDPYDEWINSQSFEE